jgi:hypothetical protein
MILSIHQPNFMPWYPFFQKMEQADVFVILSECQFEKGNFQNRFNMDGFWNTMSVNKGLEPIKNKKYVSYSRDWAKIKKRLYNHNLSIFDKFVCDSLLQTNLGIIRKIKSMLGLRCELALDFESDMTGTDRLVNICQRYGATKYIAGTGGKKYMELDKFFKAGIEVIFQQEQDMIKKPILKVINV